LGHRILFNAANLTGFGAKAIGIGLIPALLDIMRDSEFIVLIPNQGPFNTMTFPGNAQVLFIKRRNGWKNDLDRIWQLFIDVPLIAKRVKANLIFSLGDLSPAYSTCPRIVYVHTPMLVYENHESAGLSSWSLVKRFCLINYFSSISHYQNYIVQTPVMKDRLARRYNVDGDRIDIVSPAVPIHVSSNAKKIEFLSSIANCNKPIRLLFLSAYYPHKNHRILPAVAEELRRQKLTTRVHIFTTLDDKQGDSAEIRRQIGGYEDVITNLGHLSGEAVASALRSSTALFLPTLLETFGNIYLEAMLLGLPILTSDRDFAHWICKDLALFFDPLSAPSIVDSIKNLPTWLAHFSEYQGAVQIHLSNFPKDNRECAEKIAFVLYKVMGRYGK
jgi:glycosyltransferase involved in cell wall biosynthesis